MQFGGSAALSKNFFCDFSACTVFGSFSVKATKKNHIFFSTAFLSLFCQVLYHPFLSVV